MRVRRSPRVHHASGVVRACHGLPLGARLSNFACPVSHMLLHPMVLAGLTPRVCAMASRFLGVVPMIFAISRVVRRVNATP